MLVKYEPELTCDLMETYHIMDYHEVSPQKLVTLVSGLGVNSRLGMKAQGLKAPFDTVIQAKILDDLELLLWSFSKGKESDKPKMMANTLIGESKPKKDLEGFKSGKDFLAARAKLVKELQDG